jgi:hypothetical protein
MYEERKKMGKVTIQPMASPDDPIYTGELSIGARLTQPTKSAGTKGTKGKARGEVKSQGSSNKKQTLLQLALSKGFTIANPDSPIYKDGVTLSINPPLDKPEEVRRKTAAVKKPRSRKGK